MSEIDWSKAPEGTTHYAPAIGSFRALWAKLESGEFKFYDEVVDNWYWGAQPLRSETFIQRPGTWTGAGLPPVGTVCEYYIDDDKWRQCEVVAHKDGYAVIWITAAHVFSSRSCGLLRPLRTPEQIEAEEREKAVRELSAIISSKIIDRSAAVAIYEAGYRKQGEGK